MFFFTLTNISLSPFSYFYRLSADFLYDICVSLPPSFTLSIIFPFLPSLLCFVKLLPVVTFRSPSRMSIFSPFHLSGSQQFSPFSLSLNPLVTALFTFAKRPYSVTFTLDSVFFIVFSVHFSIFFSPLIKFCQLFSSLFSLLIVFFIFYIPVTPLHSHLFLGLLLLTVPFLHSVPSFNVPSNAFFLHRLPLLSFSAFCFIVLSLCIHLCCSLLKFPSCSVPRLYFPFVSLYRIFVALC